MNQLRASAAGVRVSRVHAFLFTESLVTIDLAIRPREIREFLTSLSLPQIYAALTHALANPEETEQSLRDEEVALGQLTSESSSAKATT